MPFGPRSFRTRATGPRARPAFSSHGATAELDQGLFDHNRCRSPPGEAAVRYSSSSPPARRTGRENLPPAGHGLTGPSPTTEQAMPHLTPTLPPRYRRRALAALGGLMTRAKGDVAGHRAIVERLAAAGQEPAPPELAWASRNVASPCYAGGEGSCARASRRSTRDDHRGRPGSRAEEASRPLLLARPVARVGVGERTADRLDVAGYAAMKGSGQLQGSPARTRPMGHRLRRVTHTRAAVSGVKRGAAVTMVAGGRPPCWSVRFPSPAGWKGKEGCRDRHRGREQRPAWPGGEGHGIFASGKHGCTKRHVKPAVTYTLLGARNCARIHMPKNKSYLLRIICERRCLPK